ncbi:MAG: FAD-dependent oxidoreductase [Actinobacteria bacterium]|nr:FAD-dependent oxidoreductase [Actinomycetota bacterium]
MSGNADNQYDVAILGAGFAGVAAARELAAAGRSAVVIEARDRIGGRTWTKHSEALGQQIEFGGTWLGYRSSCRFTYGEAERYGIGLVESPNSSAFASFVGGKRIDGALPVPPEQIYHFERLMTEIGIRSRELSLHNTLGSFRLDLDYPLEDFLLNLDLPPETVDYARGWFSLYYGAESHEISTLHFLSQVAGLGYSALGLVFGIVDKYDGGTVKLIDAMFADANADLRLETVVAKVSQDRSGVRVTTTDGETIHAGTAICALPLNCWGDVDFEPGLNSAKQIVARHRQPGRAEKSWILAKNLPDPHFLAAGYPTHLRYVATDYITDRGSILVSFAVPDPGFDPLDREQVQEALRVYAPEAEVLAVDAHDWNTDPFARGTWMVFRPGWLKAHAEAIREPEGRVIFAGSDVSPHLTAGWIDGAIETGISAAAMAEFVLHGTDEPGRLTAAGDAATGVS